MFERIFFLLCTLLICIACQAADIPLEFETPAQERRYESLIEELRCLVCQNQNLADSHADLAQDLREEVQRMILNGNSDVQIKEFMVARYGDFVLYRPAVKRSTWLLWGTPFLLLIVGAVILYRFAASRNNNPVTELNDQQRQQLDRLLQGEKRD